MQKIAIYGAGSCGRSIAWLVESCNTTQTGMQVVCFVDDDVSKQGKSIYGTQVLGLREARARFPDARMVTAVGSPRTREVLVQRAISSGFQFETIIHPRVERSNRIKVGEGTVICAGCALGSNIVLGRHVQVNLDCTIARDITIDDFSTLSPGVHMQGPVRMGRRVFVGVGAVIANWDKDMPLEIGDDVLIGAGACVTESVAPGVTVVGVPALPVHRHE